MIILTASLMIVSLIHAIQPESWFDWAFRFIYLGWLLDFIHIGYVWVLASGVVIWLYIKGFKHVFLLLGVYIVAALTLKFGFGL